jgi:putative FmdB family regulatory protein
MPTYDYRCAACRHEFELFQSMKDPPKRVCPSCGKKSLERLIGTGAAVLFKGSGFYQTDYRSESYKKAAEADKPADTKPSDAKPADSKPAESKTSESKPAAESTAQAKPSSKPAASAKPRPAPTKKPASRAKP